MKTNMMLYVYDNGQSIVRFTGSGRDWYVWSEKRQVRLATYKTRKELRAAFERSNNDNGAYGCAKLDL